MFKYRFGTLLILGALLLMLTPTHAQDGEVVTATVRVSTLNVRNAPNVWDTTTLIGQLYTGDVVTVHQYEQVDGWSSEELTWVYVTHEPSGLTGWVAGNYLTFSRPDWRNSLPHTNTWTGLGFAVGTQFPVPIATTAGNGGEGVIVHALPSLYGEQIGVLPSNSPVLVYGGALLNGIRSEFVYVETPDGLFKGWIHSFWVNFPMWYWSREWRGVGWVAALPIIYNQDVETEYADYPHATLNNSAPNLRAAPSLEAPIIATYYYRQGLWVAVQGRTSHDFEGWAYITVLNSGVSGWIYDPADSTFLVYEDASARANLPILQP